MGGYMKKLKNIKNWNSLKQAVGDELGTKAAQLYGITIFPNFSYILYLLYFLYI